MRRFVELIEHLRNQGIVQTYDTGQGVDAFKLVRTSLPDDLWELVQQAEVFVFSPDSEVFLDQNNATHINRKGNDVRNLDAPFKVFSVEVSGDGFMAQYPASDHFLNQFVRCIICVEDAPGQFMYLTLIDLYDDEGKLMNTHVMPSNADGPAMEHFLSRLRRERTGLEGVRQKIKVGNGKEKKHHRISRVIHVRPKSEAVGGNGTREIDWSHRFEVRGHWRACTGIGKDRAGMYCVNNFTWVSEHVRGPEHLPLIKKTRLVD